MTIQNNLDMQLMTEIVGEIEQPAPEAIDAITLCGCNGYPN